MSETDLTFSANPHFSSQTRTRQGFPLLRYTCVVPLLLLGLLTLSQHPVPLSDVALAVWLMCLSMFCAAYLLAGAVERGLWGGYLLLALMVTWLTLGIAPALALLGAGTVLTVLIQFFVQKSPAQRSVALLGGLLNQGVSRVAILAWALLAGAAVYQALGGKLPLVELSFEALPALATAFLITHLSGWVLVGVPSTGIWSNYQHWLQELLLMVLALALPVVLHLAGLLVFLIVMGLAAIQALRYQQVEIYRDRLAQRVQELSLLNNIGQSTAANLVLDDVLLNIYRQVARQVEASVFYIALYDESQKTLDFKLVMAEGKPVKWSPRRLSEGPAEYVIRHKQPLRVTADNRLQVRELGDLTQSARYLTFLGVPLLAGTRALGIMAVLSDRSEAAFDEDQMHLLQTIASQTGLAVRNALLFSESTMLARHLAVINESMQHVLFNPDRENALQAACETALTITGAEKAALFLLDGPRQHFRLSHCLGLKPEHEHYCREQAYSPTGYLNGPVVVSNVQDHPDEIEAAQLGGYQAYIKVPLRSASVVQGMLAVYYDKPHYFTPAELDLLATLAAQVTAMLDNAEVFQVLEDHVREIAQLLHLSRISIAGMELETLCETLADTLRQIMGVSRVMIMLLDSDQRRIQVLANTVQQPSRRQPAYMPLSQIPEVEFLRDSTPSSLTVHLGDPALSPELAAQMTQNEETSLTIVPIMAEGKLLGCVMLGSQEPRHFLYSDWQLMEMAVNQITVQIKNVQIYEETQQRLRERLEQISLIEDIAQQVSSSLDFNQVIHHVLEAAMKATNADLVSLALLTEDEDFYIIEQRYEQGKVVKRVSQQARDTGVIGRVVRSGEAMLVHDNNALPGYTSAYPGEYRSSLAVPLFKNDKAIGALNVESHESDFFNEDQAGFLTNLAGHAVISIENARFLEERQHEIEMLTSLRALALWLASADDTLSVAGAVMETAVSMLQGHGAVLFQYHPRTDKLLLLASSWGNSWADSHDDSPQNTLPTGAAYRAARTGHVQIVGDIHEEEAPTQGYNYDSAVAVPIKHSGQVGWVLYLTFKDRRVLQDRDLNTIDLLASQAAGHLENASLHERIRAGRDQMRTILDSTRDGMILLDRNVRLVEINLSAQRLLGINLEAYIGDYFPDTLLKYVHDAGETGYSLEQIENMARILKLQPEIITRRQFQHNNRGETLHIEEIGAPVLDEDRHIMGRLLVLRDITEEKELEAYREELTRLMVHDLRGPLAGIIQGLNTSTLLVSNSMTDEEVEDSQQNFNSMLISAKRLSRMVDSLMEIASLESREMQIKQTPIALWALVGTAVNALSNIIDQNNIEVRLEIPESLPLVNVDEDKVERVLVNLLDNAVRYTPASSTILIEARALPVSPHLQIRIADSGPGIPYQERLRIFEKFQRVPGQRPLRGHRGTGLGLALVKAVIEAHGGKIKVDDDSPLPGACFSFTLPLR